MLADGICLARPVSEVMCDEGDASDRRMPWSWRMAVQGPCSSPCPCALHSEHAQRMCVILPTVRRTRQNKLPSARACVPNIRILNMAEQPIGLDKQPINPIVPGWPSEAYVLVGREDVAATYAAAAQTSSTSLQPSLRNQLPMQTSVTALNPHPNDAGNKWLTPPTMSNMTHPLHPCPPLPSPVRQPALRTPVAGSFSRLLASVKWVVCCHARPHRLHACMAVAVAGFQHVQR